MHKVCGLIFVSAWLCAGSAQAFQLNAHMPPTIHALNPQPLPPGMQAQPQFGSGSGAGKALKQGPNVTEGSGQGSTPMALHNGTHLPR